MECKARAFSSAAWKSSWFHCCSKYEMRRLCHDSLVGVVCPGCGELNNMLLLTSSLMK